MASCQIISQNQVQIKYNKFITCKIITWHQIFINEKESIKELYYQFQSLSLMNENISLKLQDFSDKEVIQTNSIKTLIKEN